MQVQGQEVTEMRNKLRILALALIAGGTMFAQPRQPISREQEAYRRAPPRMVDAHRGQTRDRDRRARDERRERMNARDRFRAHDFRR